MSDEIKTGAYICKGCGLGDRLDCGQLATIAEREGKANVVKEHDFLCNAEGVAMIQNDIGGLPLIRSDMMRAPLLLSLEGRPIFR